MLTKVFCVVAFLAASALARPQSDLDDFNEDLNRLGPINPNPQYTYSYQVADDKEQTYLAHNENRDGDQVTGQYSYVDANGALVTVVYTAGVDGYQEERTVQDNFIEVRARPAPAPTAAPKPVTRAPAPAPTPAPRPVRPAAPVQNNDDDLVARIIAQLTPFIRDTVSNSLSSQASAPAPQPAPAAPRRVPVPAPAPVPAASGVEGVFGVGGANNVRVESPDFKFAYDF